MKPVLLKRLKRLEEIVASRGPVHFGLSAEDEDLHQREIEWYRFTAFNVEGLSRSDWWCEKYPGEPFPEPRRAKTAADDADHRFRLSAEDLVSRCIGAESSSAPARRGGMAPQVEASLAASRPATARAYRVVFW